jgi:hypothetical protein
MSDALFALLLLAGFQIKHFLADFPLQTARMVEMKGRYGHPAGLIHAATHAGLSMGLLLLAGISPGLAAALCIAEMALHYHLDWAKVRLSRRLRIADGTPVYWQSIGLDQALHQLTYIAMVAWVVA